jgi:hypothetical protein
MNGTDRQPVQVRTISVTRPKLNLLYPLVVELPNQAVQHTINIAIANVGQRLLTEQGYPSNPMTDVTANYEIKTNQRGILSLSLINYAFSGGAHGLTLQKSLTFDVQTGKPYSLSDQFKPGSNYIAVLSRMIQQQIKQRDIPLLVEFKAIRPDQDYYIADKALIIYFQVYELAAYVYGFLYFPISVYDIQNMINEDGPLGKMMY